VRQGGNDAGNHQGVRRPNCKHWIAMVAKPLSLEVCSQFYQHFMSNFFGNILLQKNTVMDISKKKLLTK
jgi:hypothetical protein